MERSRMMKTEQELKELQKEYKELQKKLAELTEEELEKVAGGNFADIGNYIIPDGNHRPRPTLD